MKLNQKFPPVIQISRYVDRDGTSRFYISADPAPARDETIQFVQEEFASGSMELMANIVCSEIRSTLIGIAAEQGMSDPNISRIIDAIETTIEKIEERVATAARSIEE